MPLKKMDIKSVVVGGGPIASLVVLRPSDDEGDARLPIRIGTVEASAISLGIEPKPNQRPMTHDLLLSTIHELGGTLRSVRIMSVSGTTFFAQLELVDAAGETHFADARPSDAIALAVREHVDVYASEEVLEAASMPDFRSVELNEQRAEMDQFHEFVENLSPEDFNVTSDEKGETAE